MPENSETQTIDPSSNAAEQARAVHQKHVTPALKQAIKDAQAAGFPTGAILNGLAAAYSDMLILTLGKERAANLVTAQAEHMRKAAAKADSAA